MDTEYTPHAAGFENALTVLTTVVSKSAKGWGVLDAGLKAFGMDHGDPTVLEAGDSWFLSDEHITFGIAKVNAVAVGDRIQVLRATINHTASQTERLPLTPDATTQDEQAKHY